MENNNTWLFYILRGFGLLGGGRLFIKSIQSFPLASLLLLSEGCVTYVMVTWSLLPCGN